MSTLPVRNKEDDQITSFALGLFALPAELQTRIFLYLSPDDLGVLSRCVEDLAGVEEDEYLRRVWFKKTAPSLLDFKLFSPLNCRPDPAELIRRGTLRGVAIISGVRSHGYWASESAVRLSRIHATLHLAHLRRSLAAALSPLTRPDHTSLHAQRILPSSSRRTSASISAMAYRLERQIAKDQVRRALLGRKVGRTLVEVMELSHGVWQEGERVREAICPSIRGKRVFFEGLARGQISGVV
ncbi:hypothetical protein M231_01779 [Tremella mesenterica]|uniref:F-box domain-containing protein n=1 Tax=Tremella mesenterica TaxID=5217 RepID=A0A4Q1BSC7_TREME|nr:hypothetical protein M231_01779 [Tremella mesenterica]